MHTPIEKVCDIIINLFIKGQQSDQLKHITEWLGRVAPTGRVVGLYL